MVARWIRLSAMAIDRNAPQPPHAGSESKHAPVAAVLGVAVVCAGLAYPVTGAALGLTSPALIAVSRALVGGLVMLPVLRVVGARLPSTRQGWGWALLIGTGNITVTPIGISEGTRLAGVAVASVLLNSAPFFAAVFARIWLGELLTRLRVLGLVVGFGGIVVIVAAEPSRGGSHVVEGAVICLAGALGWAAAGLGMRYLSVRDPAFDVWGATTAQFFCGGILLLPYLALSGDTAGSEWSSPKLWASLAFLVIGAQVIVYVGFYVALAQWTSARVFSWTFLAPAVAVAVEAVQGNLPSTLTTVGLFVVIGGVAMVTHPRAEAGAGAER
jgi:drug/metabolite transporter (DMT)-like permease